MQARIGAFVVVMLLLLATAQAKPSDAPMSSSRPDAPILLVHKGHDSSANVTHRTINASHKAVSAGPATYAE